MDFARINPAKYAEQAATWHVEFEGEPLYDKGKPIEIHLFGLEGPTGKRATAAMAKAMSRRRGKRSKEMRDMTEAEILEQMRRNDSLRARLYADITAGWNNISYIDDDDFDDKNTEAKVLEHTHENAVKLYSTRPWIMQGIDDFLALKANFMPEDVSD